jgi:CheY-like chemotaxis protein
MTDVPVQELPARARRSPRRATGPRLLLVEDDVEMRRLLASAIRKDRYEVIEAADGQELIDRVTDSIVAGQRLDCIVTDVRMPRLTGLQAIDVVRDAGLTIPVVFITAFGDPLTRGNAWMLGASAVLDKPFEIEDLLDAIRRAWLGESPPW